MFVCGVCLFYFFLREEGQAGIAAVLTVLACSEGRWESEHSAASVQWLAFGKTIRWMFCLWFC